MQFPLTWLIPDASRATLSLSARNLGGWVNRDASYVPLAQLALWRGYANRLLGEHMCEAAFDGGAPEPYRNYLTRARDAFTTAIEIACGVKNSTIETAALAGRASVNAYFGDWAAAETDSTAVPLGLVYAMPYYRRGPPAECDECNRISWGLANSPYRTLSVWNTFFELAEIHDHGRGARGVAHQALAGGQLFHRVCVLSGSRLDRPEGEL